MHHGMHHGRDKGVTLLTSDMTKDSGGLPQSLIPKKGSGTLGGLRMELKGELSSLKKAPARLEKNQDAILAAVEKLLKHSLHPL